ncbi:hypothetical protein BMETH_3400115116, partial [methanotrophic bacterial endosymbiont of Bathymodiolus sp.]
MGFLNVFGVKEPTAKMPQPPPTVGVSTVSTSFFKVETLQTTDAVAVSTVS